MPFPCGYHMERCVVNNGDIDKIKFPPIKKNEFINLSGMENYYKDLLHKGEYTKESVIYSIFEYIATSIGSIINLLKVNKKIKTIIITGGVASNGIIREMLSRELENEFNIIFPSRENSSDNAVGIAYLPLIDRWYNETKTNQGVSTK
jgi:N6-L-threonylcarbamoyladenine synthase